MFFGNDLKHKIKAVKKQAASFRTQQDSKGLGGTKNALCIDENSFDTSSEDSQKERVREVTDSDFISYDKK